MKRLKGEKRNSNNKRQKKMNKSLPVLPFPISRRRRSFTLPPPFAASSFSPGGPVFLPSGLSLLAHQLYGGADDYDLESLSSADEDDFYLATYSPAAIEMKEKMQPFFTTVPSGAGAGTDKDYCKPWELKQQEDAVYIKMDMPGVSKETVKVYVDFGFLVIKGARENDPELQEHDKEKTSNSISARINLMSMMYTLKMSEMKAEMKNGLLKVKIPKVKEEERKDIIHVQVD